MALVLKHQTEADFIKRVRETYRNAVGDEAIDVGAYIDAAIQRGDLPDASVRAAFGHNAATWNNARARMRARLNARNTVRTAVGE